LSVPETAPDSRGRVRLRRVFASLSFVDEIRRALPVIWVNCVVNRDVIPQHNVHPDKALDGNHPISTV